jgi:hypothetical protein
MVEFLLGYWKFESHLVPTETASVHELFTTFP